MSNFFSIPLLAIAAALQASIVPQIRLLGGGPDLIFLIVLAWAINADLEDSVLWAFAGGIMQDLMSAAPVGSSVLGMLLLVFAISGLGQQVYRIGFTLLVGLVLAGTLLQQIIVMVILSISGFSIDWLGAAPYVVAPTVLYNLVFIWPIYWIMRQLQSQNRGREREFSIN